MKNSCLAPQASNEAAFEDKTRHGRAPPPGYATIPTYVGFVRTGRQRRDDERRLDDEKEKKEQEKQQRRHAKARERTRVFGLSDYANEAAGDVSSSGPSTWGTRARTSRRAVSTCSCATSSCSVPTTTRTPCCCLFAVVVVGCLIRERHCTRGAVRSCKENNATANGAGPKQKPTRCVSGVRATRGGLCGGPRTHLRVLVGVELLRVEGFRSGA
jgi:hypothetical protein